MAARWSRPRIVLGVLAGLAVLVIGTATVLYAVNPSGTASADPRARIFGYVTYKIASGSMSPTLQGGDMVAVSSWEYAHEPPRRGDVIVHFPPHNPGLPYVSRVAAVAGDVVSIRDGVLHVNGGAVSEPYLEPAALERPESLAVEDTTVPVGALYLLGDNRDHSEDSRHRGFASTDAVVGRVARILVADDLSRVGKVN